MDDAQQSDAAQEEEAHEEEGHGSMDLRRRHIADRHLRGVADASGGGCRAIAGEHRVADQGPGDVNRPAVARAHLLAAQILLCGQPAATSENILARLEPFNRKKKIFIWSDLSPSSF